MIEVKKLTKSYGSHEVLREIDFTVEKGEIYGFLGHNGAGKSTTMNILTGLINYDSGDITVKGLSMKDNRQTIRQIIGYLPEDPKFYGYMTAREYLNFIGTISSYTSSIKKRTAELLDMVNITENADKRTGSYSRGMRQRLGIAAALYNSPEIIVFDEPSSALDPMGRKDVAEILLKLKEEGAAVFLSTHILSDVENICDRISIIDNGKIILQDRLETLMNTYALPLYDIIFEKENHEAVKKIEHAPWCDSINREKSLVSVYVNNADTAGKEILKILGESQSQVISFSKRKSSLEDIFIKAAGR